MSVSSFNSHIPRGNIILALPHELEEDICVMHPHELEPFKVLTFVMLLVTWGDSVMLGTHTPVLAYKLPLIFRQEH